MNMFEEDLNNLLNVEVHQTDLRVDTNDLIALFAAIGEDALVALDAERVLIPEDIALAREGLVTLPAAEVTAVPILVHRLGVLAAENELERKTINVNENWYIIANTDMGIEDIKGL